MSKENGMGYVYERGLKYILRLRVTGITSRSQDVIRKVREICEQELHGFYKLEVIYEQPDQPDGDQNVSLPTMLKRLPSPLKRLVSDLSNKERVISGMEIVPREWAIRESFG